MSRRKDDGDRELRELLDSIGLRGSEAAPTPDQDSEDHQRAQEMLARILNEPGERPPGRISAKRARNYDTWSRWISFKLVSVVAVCAVLTAVVVIAPWSGQQSAMAQTPPLLHFSKVKAAEVSRGGEPAGGLLNELAAQVEGMPQPAWAPVQRIELDAWWSATDPADGSTTAHFVLVPRRLEVYQFPNGERRAIERRGEPLDRSGRVSEQNGSWDDVPLDSDETTDNDLGAAYADDLPTELEKLRQHLAPDEVCSESRGGCLLSAVNDLFASYVVSPRVTARVWQLLATEPSITTLGTTTDRLGREALVFSAVAPDARQRVLILINPTDGRYLGSETILVEEDAELGFKPPAVTQFTALVTSARVAAGAVPDDSTTTRY